MGPSKECMPNGTMSYYDQVTKLDPDVRDFYRVFFGPGVGHCGGGIGPISVDALLAL
jgi:feruloyl esterase